MRIVILTAGTGSYFCGTCVRDNALAAALHRQGHDAMLVPMYLEPVLDEAPAHSGTPLFYGGINVYLQQKLRLFRRTPRWLDRLLDAPGLLSAAAKRSGMTDPRDLGEITLSMLRGEDGAQVKELERLVAWLETEGRPDVVCLSNALLLGLARRIRQRLGARVVCFLNGEDCYLDSLPEPYYSQAWSAVGERAADVDLLLPVSRYFGDLMTERAGLPRDRVAVLYPGISLEGYEAPTSAPADPPVIGYLARMCRAKGLETLVEAFVRLRAGERHRGARLRVAGSCTAEDEALVSKLKERLAAAGLADQVQFFPNVDRDEKIAFLRGLTLFSAPGTYGEAFGLYLLEAMAAGVPVVQPRHAAFPEVLDQTGGGVLCEPDNPASLARALEELLNDPQRARQLGEAGRRAVHERFSVDRSAAEALRFFEGLAVARVPAGVG